MDKLDLYGIINNISNGHKLIDREDFDAKKYNAFVAVKSLSKDYSLAPYLQAFNTKSIRKADPYAHYVALFHVIPKKRRYLSMSGVSNKYDQKMVAAVCAYYQISEHKSEMYLDTLTKKQREELTEMCDRTGLTELRS